MRVRYFTWSTIREHNPDRVGAGGSVHGSREVHFGTEHGRHVAALWRWDAIGDAVRGPAVITGEGSTVLVPPGWTVRPAGGHLEITR